MANNYNKLYQTTPNALGEPTAAFVEFFQNLETGNLSVLDVGCGQGRDAIFIAKMGHRVVGVDVSTSGIGDLNKIARQEELPIKGIVADITKFDTEECFDIILIDRTLHMLPKDLRGKVFSRLIDSLKHNGWVLIADERANFPIFHKVLSRTKDTWNIIRDTKGFLFVRR